MFDPVHAGHLRTALAAQQDFGLDEVRLIPCHHPVHRDEAIASARHRIAMLHKATKAESQLVVDVRECMKAGPSYMIETLESLRIEYPNDRLFLILGADAFNKLDSWYRWQQLFDVVHLIVITRPGWEIKPAQIVSEFCHDKKVTSFAEMCEQKCGSILKYSFTPLMIASSDIRELIKQEHSVRYLLPNAVLKYISKHKLYS